MNPVKFSDLFESWLFEQSGLQADLRLKLKRTALNMRIKLLYNCNLLSQENNAKLTWYEEERIAHCLLA